MKLNHQNFIEELESEILDYHPWIKEQWEEQYQELVQYLDNPEDHSKNLINTFMPPTWDLFLKQIDLILDEMDKNPNLYGYLYINKEYDVAHASLVNDDLDIERLKTYGDPTSNPRFFIAWD